MSATIPFKRLILGAVLRDYAEYRKQKRAGQEDVDSDYLFGNAKREIPNHNLREAKIPISSCITPFMIANRK
jgi:hypothetical protein